MASTKIKDFEEGDCRFAVNVPPGRDSEIQL